MPTRIPSALARLWIGVVAGTLALGCASSTPLPDAVTPSRIGGMSFIGPRCADVRSCLVGQVVAAETATPLPQAAVFLERQDGEPLRILTLTDDQGVFTVADAPLGTYRLAIYKDARRIERRGLKLGAPGTVLVPVRLSPS